MATDEDANRSSAPNVSTNDGDITQADVQMGNSEDTFFSDIDINSDDEQGTGGILDGLQLDMSGDTSLLVSLPPPETPVRDDSSTQRPLQDLSTQARNILERHKNALVEADWSDHTLEDVQVMGTPIERQYSRPSMHVARHLGPIDSDGEDTAFVEETPYKSPPFKTRKLNPEPSAIGTPLRGFKSKNTIPATPPADQCLFFYWPGDGWYPAVVPDAAEFKKAREIPKEKITVVFGTDEEGLVAAASAVPVDLQVGDLVRYDKIQYKIIGLLESGSDTKFVTSAGFDTLELEPLRMSRRMRLEPVTVSVKDVFLREQEFSVWNTDRLARAASSRSLYQSFVATNGANPPLASMSAGPLQSQIFAKCMFCVTMANLDNAAAVTKSVVENSGRLVENFDEIVGINPDGRLSWKAGQEFTFGAVIAARPLRSPKYLSGLASGWPCLSYQFVTDCVTAGRFLENWKDYLLAAGDSVPLDSPVSLDISDFYQKWTAQCALATQFEQRSLAMGGLTPDVYFVGNEKDSVVELLLRLATAKPPKVVNSIDAVDKTGVVVIFAKPPAQLPSSLSSGLPAVSALDTVPRLTKQLVLPETAVYSRDWLIQCIINRRIV